MLNISGACLTAIFAASTVFGQSTPVVGSRPEDLVITSRHAPELRLHNVVFVECQTDAPNICRPKFRAALVDANKQQWQAVTLLVVASLKDGTGKLFETEYDPDDGTIYANPDNLYNPADVTGYNVRFVKGMRLETHEVNSYEGPVAKDLGCYHDLQAALAREGLAQRKALVELVEYGCVEVASEDMRVMESHPVRGSPSLLEVELVGSAVMRGIIKRSDVVKTPMLLREYYSE